MDASTNNNARGGGSDVAGMNEAALPTLRSRLFRKYAILFLLAVGVALLASSAVEVWSSYRDHTAWLIRIQGAQAEAAAAQIGQFIEQIEAELGWTTQFYWAEQPPAERQADALRVLRQVPAVMDLARVDPEGHEQLHVSRTTATVVGSNIDFSHEPQFTEAIADGVYHGPVYFREATEPYMTLAVGRRGAGVTVAEISLKYIWDVVSGIKVGEHGAAYVVDGGGKLIAHPDLSLVLRNTDLSGFAQVRTARALEPPDEAPHLARDMSGRQVLTANAAIPSLGWLVFVELPVNEAYAPLYASLTIRAVLLLAGLGFAMLLSLALARGMVRPIRALQAGAARIGAGRLDHRIHIASGDELQALGDQFNSMAARLQDSYATLEGKVAERTRELELANLAKTRFLAAASHDLRQPLHALGLLVARLDADINRAERRRVVAQIGAAVAGMNELFSTLLDISKLDAGAVKPMVTEFPIGPVLSKIESMFAPVARAKSLRLYVRPNSAWVRSDRMLLERILLNLVSNAVRYTQTGGVVVGCRGRGDTLRLEVWDSGIGIPHAQQQDIFREFYQVGGAQTSTGAPGLGLGLAIVDRLCRLLNHPITLASVPGKGSRFAIAVPLAPAQDEPVALADPLAAVLKPFAGRLVVIIDDNALVLDSVGGLLRGWGCRVTTAASSAAALGSLRKLRQRPDLVICDYHLTEHGENGTEAIARVRASFDETIPALLITGDISVERKQEAEAGGYELLQKPVPPITLRATLTAILRPRDSADALRDEAAAIVELSP